MSLQQKLHVYSGITFDPDGSTGTRRREKFFFSFLLRNSRVIKQYRYIVQCFIHFPGGGERGCVARGGGGGGGDLTLC